jgi:hypothetical protein
MSSSANHRLVSPICLPISLPLPSSPSPSSSLSSSSSSSASSMALDRLANFKKGQAKHEGRSRSTSAASIFLGRRGGERKEQSLPVSFSFKLYEKNQDREQPWRASTHVTHNKCPICIKLFELIQRAAASKEQQAAMTW